MNDTTFRCELWYKSSGTKASNGTNFSRSGSGCPTGMSWDGQLGQCGADGGVCTDPAVEPPRVLQAGICINLGTATQATQCKYFATGQLPQTRKYWIAEGTGDPKDAQKGKDATGCETVSAVPDLEKDCVFQASVEVPAQPGAGAGGADLPGYTSVGGWKCKLSSTLTGNVAPNTSGVNPSQHICADPGSPACTLPELPKDKEQKPCVYKVNGAGEEICFSSYFERNPGKEKCGYVSSEWKCAADLPKAVGNGLFIATNVKTEALPDGKTKITKTDKLTETSCKGAAACTSKETTSKTITIKDGGGKTESTATSCTGASCPDNTNPDADGDGFGDCTGDDCGEDESSGGDPVAMPELDEVPGFAESIGTFSGRVKASPLVSTFSSIRAPSGGACYAPTVDTQTVLGSVTFDGHCQVLEGNRDLIRLIAKVLWALLATWILMG